MRTWTLHGREVTDRDGAAARAGLAETTVDVYAAPYGRRRYGWPEPVDTDPARSDVPEELAGAELFAVDDIDAFVARRRRRATQNPPLSSGDPDELIDWRQFAQMHGIAEETMRHHIDWSLNAWGKGEDGSIPLPDNLKKSRKTRMVRRTGRLGRPPKYLWLRATAAAWTPGRGGRKAGRRPKVADLKAVLAEYEGDRPPTARQIAAGLSDRIGGEVSVQTVWRLQRTRRSEQAAS